MSIGKIENKDLSKFLNNIRNSKDVLVNPKIGEDCAVVSMDSENLIITSDPITSIVKNIGELGVDVNLNDLYATGAMPLGIMVTLLFPKDTQIEEIEKLFNEINQKCQRENINILGGHTEVTDGVNRTIVSITAVGKTIMKKFLSYDFKPFDKIFLTKGYAIEGTVILLENYFEDICNDAVCVKEYFLKLYNQGSITKEDMNNYVFEDENLKREDFLEVLKTYKEQLSIKMESEIARKYNVKVHDVTEGGVFGGLYELLEGRDFGCNTVFLYDDVNPITRRICAKFGISPFKLISSGSALLIVEEALAKDLKQELENSGLLVFLLGEVIDGEKIAKINTKEEILINNEKDELYKI